MKFKYPVYVIVWDDAESDSSWRDVNELHLKPSLALTFGFLLREDENYVIIGDSYFVEASDKTISNTTKIPKGMIKEQYEVKITKVKTPKTIEKPEG